MDQTAEADLTMELRKYQPHQIRSTPSLLQQHQSTRKPIPLFVQPYPQQALTQALAFTTQLQVQELTPLISPLETSKDQDLSNQMAQPPSFIPLLLTKQQRNLNPSQSSSTQTGPEQTLLPPQIQSQSAIPPKHQQSRPIHYH